MIEWPVCSDSTWTESAAAAIGAPAIVVETPSARMALDNNAREKWFTTEAPYRSRLKARGQMLEENLDGLSAAKSR
jgi:hypothetical protein